MDCVPSQTTIAEELNPTWGHQPDRSRNKLAPSFRIKAYMNICSVETFSFFWVRCARNHSRPSLYKVNMHIQPIAGLNHGAARASIQELGIMDAIRFMCHF